MKKLTRRGLFKQLAIMGGAAVALPALKAPEVGTNNLRVYTPIPEDHIDSCDTFIPATGDIRALEDYYWMGGNGIWSSSGLPSISRRLKK